MPRLVILPIKHFLQRTRRRNPLPQFRPRPISRLFQPQHLKYILRRKDIQALSDRGIGTSVHYVPLHRQPYWRDRYGLTPEMFPHADAAYQSMLSIPLFSAMSDASQQRVVEGLQEILG